MVYPRSIFLSLLEQQVTPFYITFSLPVQEKEILEKVKFGKLYLIYTDNIQIQMASFYVNQSQVKTIYPEQTLSNGSERISSFDVSLSYFPLITHIKVFYSGQQESGNFKFVLNVPEEIFNNPFIENEAIIKSC